MGSREKEACEVWRGRNKVNEGRKSRWKGWGVRGSLFGAARLPLLGQL